MDGAPASCLILLYCVRMHVRSIVAHDPSLAEIITTGFVIASPKGKREFTFTIFADDALNWSIEKTHVICGYPTIQPILYDAKVLPLGTHICIAANKFAIHYTVYI
ncbi:hypothetical protein IFM47457_09093 [Aspergillus lentulus]|nr:hypothetical protein IFM47457_09093 [Aspergillus lentulus]